MSWSTFSKRLGRVVIVLLVVGLILPLSVSALAHNHNELASLHCLADVIAAPSGLPQVSPNCAMEQPVPMAIWGSINEQTDIALQGLARAVNEQSTFTDSLFAVAQAESANVGWPLSLPSRGLAEYYALLAFQAEATRTPLKALEFFQRALTHRPGGWAQDFSEHYKNVLGKVEPQALTRVIQEQSALVGPVPQVNVGQKQQSGWDIPILVADGWVLQGYTLKSQTAFELGLPIDVDLFWKSPTGQVVQQSVTTFNMMPNGGFEMPYGAKPGWVWGWLQRTPQIIYVGIPQLKATLGTRESTVLISRPNPGVDDYKISPVIHVTPDSYLLWSVWIQSEQGAPHIFVSWLDENENGLRDEIPMQGNAQGLGRHYAGVLRVPAGAAYMYWALVNLESPGTVVWDDVLLIPLNPPSP